MSVSFTDNPQPLRNAWASTSGWNLPGILISTGVLMCLAVATAFGGLEAGAGVIAFLVLLAVTFFYPDRMLLATLVVAIFISIEIAIKVEPFPRVGPTRIVVAALFVGTLLNWWTKRQPIRERMRSLPLLGLVLAYSAAVLVSTFMSISPRKSYYSASVDIVEQFFVFYLFVFYLRQSGFWPRLQKVLFASTAVVCAFAVVEEITKYNPMAFSLVFGDDLNRGGLLRVRATFFHPIALGCFIDLVFPFVLTALIQGRNRQRKVELALLLAGMLVTSFLTVSRGPWIALLLEMGLFVMWLGWSSVRQMALLAIFLATITLVSALLLPTTTLPGKMLGQVVNPNHFSLSRTNEASSEYYRIALVKAVIERLEGTRWLYGFGRGTFYVADVESKYDDANHVLTAGDSQYVLLLLETGIAGLGSFLLMLIAVLGLCVRAVRTATAPNELTALACLAAAAGFIVNNTTVSMFSLLPLNMLFWMSVALASACLGRRMPRKRPNLRITAVSQSLAT